MFGGISFVTIVAVYLMTATSVYLVLRAYHALVRVCVYVRQDLLSLLLAAVEAECTKYEGEYDHAAYNTTNHCIHRCFRGVVGLCYGIARRLGASREHTQRKRCEGHTVAEVNVLLVFSMPLMNPTCRSPHSRTGTYCMSITDRTRRFGLLT